MKINSNLFSAKNSSGTNVGKSDRREEWILTGKLGLLAIAIFATVILLGMWQQ